MKLFLQILPVAFVMLACTESKQNVEKSTVESTNESSIDNKSNSYKDSNEIGLKEVDVVKKCYEYHQNNESIVMSIEIDEDNFLTGEMTFIKNDSLIKKGIISGQYDGDKIVAELKYLKENKGYSEELFFLQKENGRKLIQSKTDIKKQMRSSKKVDQDNINFNGKVYAYTEDCL
ncbi:MAG: hypothetical protein ACQESK_03840 [Bacteroidota bacterium]